LDVGGPCKYPSKRDCIKGLCLAIVKRSQKIEHSHNSGKPLRATQSQVAPAKPIDLEHGMRLVSSGRVSAAPLLILLAAALANPLMVVPIGGKPSEAVLAAMEARLEKAISRRN
jgi:hypothetical protein